MLPRACPRRRRLSLPSSSGGEEGGGGEGSRASPRQQRRKEREQREAFREQYYAQGVSYGKPAACLMFDLAYQLNHENAHMLWLALVGLTDHLVHNRISGARAARRQASRCCRLGWGWPRGGWQLLCVQRYRAGLQAAAAWAGTLPPSSQSPFTASFPPAPVPTHLEFHLFPFFFGSLQPTSTWSTTSTTRPTSAATATWTCLLSGRWQTGRA